VATLFMWIVVLGGLAILGSCFMYPREIGKEDRALIDVKVDVQRIEDMALRMRLATERRLAERKARVAERRARVAERRASMASSASSAQTAPPPIPLRPVVEPPPAMGAPQPVLTEDPAAAVTLNGSANGNGNGGSVFDAPENGFL
jgi:hypothetical protein